MDAIRSNLPYMLKGLELSLEYSVAALLLAVVLGGSFGTLFYSLPRRVVRWPILAWVGLFRNTPLIVQLYIWYFGVPYAGIKLSAGTAAIVGLGFYGSSYVTEIVRSGLSSVGDEQEEAALAIGLTRRDAVRRVIWPQALPVLIPPMTNEAVALFKNSSLLGFITVSELTLRTQEAISTTFASLPLYLTAGGMYLVINVAFSVAMRRLEHRTALHRNASAREARRTARSLTTSA